MHLRWYLGKETNLIKAGDSEANNLERTQRRTELDLKLKAVQRIS